MSQITIRDLCRNELALAASFFHEHWRKDHVFKRHPELLLWQYGDNPAADTGDAALTFKVALEGDTLLGVFAYMPFVFNEYGQRKRGCYLSAWWIEASHRRGPLALRLLQELQHRLPSDACVSGMNTPAAERLYHGMGWVVVDAVPRFVRVVDEALLAKLLGEAGAEAPASLPANPAAGGQVILLDDLSSLRKTGWDDWYWTHLAPGHMGPAKESEHLVWRYRDIPLFRYETFAAQRDGNPTGLLVFRQELVRDTDISVIRVVDLPADAGDSDALLSALVEEAARRDVAMIDIFCTHECRHESLLRAGFVQDWDPEAEAYRLPYLFQPLDCERRRLNTAWWIRDVDLKSERARRDFMLMKGDYEFDRPN